MGIRQNCEAVVLGMEFRINIIGDAELSARLASMSNAVIAAADKAALAGGMLVEGFAKKNFRTVAPGGKGTEMGPPIDGILTVRSGKLRSSIHVTKKGGGSVSVGPGNLAYAAIHEFGGTTAARVIRARKGKALAFMGRDGNMVVRRSVNHPGSRMPKRPYMRPAIEKPGNVEAIRAAVVRVIKRELSL